MAGERDRSQVARNEHNLVSVERFSSPQHCSIHFPFHAHKVGVVIPILGQEAQRPAGLRGVPTTPAAPGPWGAGLPGPQLRPPPRLVPSRWGTASRLLGLGPGGAAR